MFHATLDSTKTWKQIVDALATLLTEVNFVISDNGLTLCQLDSSKAAMIDLNLPAGVFQEFNCTETRKVCLGVDELVKISKRMASDDRLEFSVDEKGQKFVIRMVGQADRKFSLMLLTPPDEDRKSKPMPFDARAELYADAFKQAVKDVGVVSGHIRIIAKDDTLTFTGGGDIGEAHVTLKTGDDSPLYDLEIKKEASAMYALSYLSEITKAISSDTVALQYATDKPLQMEFGVAEGGTIKFILAPRIERR